MKHKHLFSFVGLAVLALLASTIPAFAAAVGDGSFAISRDGREIAKVTISSGRDGVSAVVERLGQPAHKYLKSTGTGDVTVSVNGKVVMVYNNKTGDFTAPTPDGQSAGAKGNVSGLKWGEGSQPVIAAAIRSVMADDMKAFRAVRGFDEAVNTRAFEFAYVILSGDESIYWMKDLADYKVTGPETKD